MDEFHKNRKEVKQALKEIVDPRMKASLSTSYEQIVSNQREYFAYLIGTKHQGDYYWYVLANLPPGEVVVIKINK